MIRMIAAAAVVGMGVWSAPALAQKATDDDAEIVVTANRTEQRRENVPASIEVVTEEELSRTFGLNFLDLLKKNASLDVIQYPNGLAGIGLRGLRPDFEFTINPRTLVLVDGRPSGSTSFTTISPESIARVEVLKGPASALYGASAVGGVVNIITRRSNGPLDGQATVGYGSFDTVRTGATLGGTLAGPFDFDLDLGYVSQMDDFRAGNGEVRPNSTFNRMSGKVRIGATLAPIARIDSSIDFAVLDNDAPGPLSFNPQNRSGNETDRLSGDVRLELTPDDHQIRLVGYHSREQYDFIEVPVGQLRYLGTSVVSRNYGTQIQDSWQIARPLQLTYGFDWQKVEADRKRFFTDGARRAPSSPNESRETYAVFGEGVLAFMDERLILTAGGRYDWITAKTLTTPFRPSFTPGTAKFGVFNPRGGAVFKFNDALRIHGTIGRAFVPPQALQLAGESEEFAGRQRRVTFGNPDLQPERNTSWDLGVGYANSVLNADITYFDATTRNRITTVTLTETPLLRETSYINSDRSKLRGVEGILALDGGAMLGLPRRRFGITASITHIIEGEDILPTGPTPIRNVADWKANLSATVSTASGLSGTVTARYNGSRFDNDNSQGRIFTGGVGGLFAYDDFVIVDLSGRLRVSERDLFRLEIANLLDKDYFEKADYPMQGRAAYVRYSRTF